MNVRGQRDFWLTDVVTITQQVNVSGDIKTVSGEIHYMMCDMDKCKPPNSKKFTASFEPNKIE